MVGDCWELGCCQRLVGDCCEFCPLSSKSLLMLSKKMLGASRLPVVLYCGALPPGPDCCHRLGDCWEPDCQRFVGDC